MSVSVSTLKQPNEAWKFNPMTLKEADKAGI